MRPLRTLAVVGLTLLGGLAPLGTGTASAATPSCEWLGTLTNTQKSTQGSPFGLVYSDELTETFTARLGANGCENVRTLDRTRTSNVRDTETCPDGSTAPRTITTTDRYAGTAPAQVTVQFVPTDTGGLKVQAGATGDPVPGTRTVQASGGCADTPVTTEPVAGTPGQIAMSSCTGSFYGDFLVPNDQVQAVAFRCANGYPGTYFFASVTQEFQLAKNPCDASVDSDGDGVGDCAEHAAGTDPLKAPVTVNRAPVAHPDTASTRLNTAVRIDVLANDTDPDGDELTLVSCTRPARGKAVVSEGAVVYTPKRGFRGVETFSCTVRDPAGATAGADVTVSVSPGKR